MSKKTIHVAYFSLYHEAIAKKDMTICVRPYEVEIESSAINDDGSINASALYDCRDLINDINHKKIDLKPFEIEAYLNVDIAIKQVEKYI